MSRELLRRASAGHELATTITFFTMFIGWMSDEGSCFSLVALQLAKEHHRRAMREWAEP